LILRGIVDESQRSGKARRLISSALAYPVLLLLVILIVTSLFSWLIAPVYQEIFADFGVGLPAVTRAILGFHQGVRDSHGLQLLIPAAMLVGAFVYFSLTAAPGRARLLHVLPVVGSLNRLAAQSQFCRYLADFVQAKISVADALRISGRNTGHFLLRDEANTLADRLELGAAHNSSALPIRMVPNTAIHVCQSNADSGAGARILRELAAMYDQQMENRLSFVVNLLEPVFVMVLGIAVGVHFIALIMPLVSLIQNLT
jgi:type IV pilus assembly protein PilC